MCDAIEIYVACLASYNAGKTHGIWIDASKPIEDIYDDIHAMLKTSPMPSAEEFEIQDFNNLFYYDIFPSKQSIEEIHDIAVFLQEYGDVGAALLEEIGGDCDEAESLMESGYYGKYDSLTEFICDFAQDIFNMNERLLTYIDVEKLWRDLQIDGYFAVNVGYTVHIFFPH